MIDSGRTTNTFRAAASWRSPRRSAPTLAALVLFLSMFGPYSGDAHDTIDPDRINAILAATDAAVMRVKGAAGPASEGEALFALGMIQVELTAILNRDLAAHSGQLTFNGQSLQKSLAGRDLAPRFDDTIGRYRLPTASLARALRLSPDAPDALHARFELLKAGFYESFVLDPFQLVGMGFDDLDGQIADAKALASALPTPDDAEEAAFIHAVDLARAARLVREPEAARSYTGLARTALGAFAETYPQSMRAASAAVILKSLGGPNDPN
jgi:hypothetical protein